MLLLSELDHTESEISDIIQKNKEIGNQIYHLDEEIAEKEVLQNRYKSLQSQYSSDLKRLTFMVEGEIRKKDFVSEAPRECPFCGNHLSEDKTDSCIEAATAEIEKLEPKMADLKSVQKSLKNELDKITAERDRLKALMDELEEQVQEELREYGVYRPNIFVMDSPILSLKEDVDASELARTYEAIKKRMERIRAEIREEILECLEMNCRGSE